MTGHKAALGFALLLAVNTSSRSAAQPGPARFSGPVVLALAGPALAEAGGGTSAAGEQGQEAFIPPDRLEWHLPDPEAYRPDALKRLEKAEQGGDTAAATFLNRILERVDSIRRSQQLHLTLEDVLRRTLENSFAIKVQSYNPAVETTRIVEAEAAFDALFFSNITKNKVDQPTASQLFSGDLDAFDSSFGIRKLLPSGTQVDAYYSLEREKTTLSFQQLNPAYTSGLVLDLRQPLLRGFGIDVNRALIHIYKNNRRISDLAFRRQVRDTIRQVEELYWRLVQARRDIVITARLLADFEKIYEYLQARREFDVIKAQLAETKADLEQSRAEFVQKRATVFDAEDQLIAAMNDSEVNLADDTEIIPEELPQLASIVVDRLAEAQTALQARPEIKEARLNVENAKIAVGQAKNAELPQLDLTFTYRVLGLAGTADKSFDEASRHNYVTYTTGVQFEMPIGNRRPRAAHYRARLEYARAKAALELQLEQVILEVNMATRELTTSYDQIMPTFESAEARERQVESIIARAERKDIATLSTELGAHRNLANARRAMLNAMVEYNIAIIELERTKGTLLRYNNIVIATEEQ